MIIGLGVDIEQVNRIEEVVNRHGEAFLKRIYTPGEISYCERHKNKFERYAARFAVKEATMKALGTGWRRGVRWRDIEVVNLPTGKPVLKLAGASKEIADRMGVKHISISISHGINFAIAQVIFEGDEP